MSESSLNRRVIPSLMDLALVLVNDLMLMLAPLPTSIE